MTRISSIEQLDQPLSSKQFDTQLENGGIPEPFFPDYKDVMIQNLGHDEENPPNYGQVFITSSEGVHLGAQYIYQGPVTIKQTVYSTDDSVPVPLSDKARSNLSFSNDNDDGNLDRKVTDDQADTTDLGKTSEIETGRHRIQNVLFYVIVSVLLLLIIIIVAIIVFVKNNGESAYVKYSEPNEIQPIEYNQDLANDSSTDVPLRLVARQQWLAQPPINETTPLKTPVSIVIIHHTATEFCASQAQCIFHVRYIQTFHIESNGWYDIGYNFLVGGDGAAYVGRDWTVEGAHTLGWNRKSIGIAFIGTFITKTPPKVQISACQKLIERGISLGYITKNYRLLAARQLFGTESPGEAFYKQIKQWNHWSSEASVTNNN